MPEGIIKYDVSESLLKFVSINFFNTVSYDNHLEQIELQLPRKRRALPKMVLNPAIKDIFEFTYGDFKLEGDDPIKGSVAV